MKAYLIKLISAYFIAIALFTACSKQGVESNDANKGASAQQINNEPTTEGTVIGTVLPTDADPIIFMRGNIEVKIAVNPDGSIARNSVPKGDYTVQVHPNNPAYADAIIYDIRVEPGQTTDLGKIVLPRVK